MQKRLTTILIKNLSIPPAKGEAMISSNQLTIAMALQI